MYPTKNEGPVYSAEAPPMHPSQARDGLFNASIEDGSFYSLTEFDYIVVEYIVFFL